MTAAARTAAARKFRRIETSVEAHGWLTVGSSTTTLHLLRQTRDGQNVDVDITADGDKFTLVVRRDGQVAAANSLTATAIIAKLSA